MSEYKLPEGFKKITLQDIFNAAWQAFIVEDRPPAATEMGYCRYLTDDGRKCAVGLCIPDGHPAQYCEVSWGSMAEEFPDLWDIDSLHVDFDFFQRQMHDTLQTNGVWKKDRRTRADHYRAIATRYNLTIPGE